MICRSKGCDKMFAIIKQSLLQQRMQTNNHFNMKLELSIHKYVFVVTEDQTCLFFQMIQ